MKNFRFTVKGSGEFPYVMLARGACHPSQEEDSRSMANFSSARSVNLVGLIPNEDSWRSFGWSIIVRPPLMLDDYNTYHTWPC
jgi:hypothetical protein